MNMNGAKRNVARALCAISCLAVAPGCDDGDQGGILAGNYAVPTEILGADTDTSTGFIAVVPSLDVDEISLDQALEVDGRASAASVDNWLFVAGAGKTSIQRYEIGEDGSLTQDEKLDFKEYGIPYNSVDAWGNKIISSTKAYNFNGSDGSHVIWNPSTMNIEGEIPAPDIVEEGFQAESSPPVVRGDRMYRVFTLLNYETWEFPADAQYLAVYDIETDELVNLVSESRCPQLYSRPFLDENNHIYFSGWVWTPGLTLVDDDYPKNCALRVLDGEDEFDPDWQLNYAEDITDGRETGILRYLGDGKALLDVFHDERATIDMETSASELSNTPNWHLWLIDLNDMTGQPVDGLDFKAAGYSDDRVDDRVLLFSPNESYSETTAFEIIDGEAVEAYKIEGYHYHLAEL